MADGGTPTLSGLFRMAVISGTPASVLLHLRRGASVNARDANGATPLMLAMARGRADICQLLLEEGADPRMRDNAGRAVLDYVPADGGTALADLIVVDGRDAATTEEPDETTADHTGVAEAAPAGPAPLGEPGVEFASGWSPLQRPATQTVSSQPQNEHQKLAVVETDSGEPVSDGSLWEAEDLTEAPEDNPDLKAAAVAVQADIGRHKAISADEDWSDIEIDLPEVAPRRLRDPRRRAELERLRSLFRRSLDIGSFSATDVPASLAAPMEGEGEDLAERRLHAAFVTLAALGLAAEDWEEWTACLPRRRPGRRDADLADEACQFFEQHWAAETALELWYREVGARPVPSAEQEAALWRRYDAAVAEACASLLAVPGAASSLISALEADLRSLTSTEVTFADEPSPEADDDDEPDAPEEAAESLYGWGRPELETALELLKGVQEGRADADALRKQFLLLLEVQRLPASLIEDLSRQVETDELDPAAGGAIRSSLQKLRRHRDQLFGCHMKLAVWIARRYGWSRLPLEDRIQEGNIGLLKAIDRFDPRRGSKFSTYAVWWIRQGVTRAIHDQGRTIRLPVHITDTARRVEVTQEALSWELRRAPVPSELAEKMNLPLEQVTRLLRVLGEPMSLELMNEQEGEDASCLPDVGQDPEDLAMTAGLRRVIAAALLGITAREERIVRLRFGMNLKSDLTLEEIGRPWDITRERVRQIEAAALRKLKHPSRSRRLRQFLESEA